MESTNKFDKYGQEIFVGDAVMKWWGSFHWKGKSRNMLQYHIITKNPAHMMGNGQMHDDGNGFTYNLGRYSNFWKGEDVVKLNGDHSLIKGEYPPDTEFFLDDDGTVVKFTDQHFMNLTDEQYEEFKNRYNGS